MTDILKESGPLIEPCIIETTTENFETGEDVELPRIKFFPSDIRTERTNIRSRMNC